MRHRDEASLVGWYFQSFACSESKPGVKKVRCQGRVIGRPETGWYLVQFYAISKYEPGAIKLVKFEEMLGWEYYTDADFMMADYDSIMTAYEKSQVLE